MDSYKLSSSFGSLSIAFGSRVSAVARYFRIISALLINFAVTLSHSWLPVSRRAVSLNYFRYKSFMLLADQ